MKIKLSPELSYLIGLWRKARCPDGVGVEGGKNVLEIFTKEVLDRQLTTSDKMLTGPDKVYFYHTAYRKFFQQIESEQLERFKYLNEYAANYIAGMFDATGSIDERGVVSLGFATKQDEMMLLRLGFQTRRRADRLIIERPVLFLTFIKNYVQAFKDHKVFEIIRTQERAPKKG
ncbi:LAGLIDADG family homing endonuclease [Candidatus Micrarchaeota archaeon]|nr:LAGLIDADG family homing endonuclease [Candidatus Micrarchaeota archaeon]